MNHTIIKTLLVGAATTVFAATTLAQPTLPTKMICEGAEVSKIGYGSKSHHINLFKSDLRSDKQKSLSTSEKVKRIEAAIRRKHSGTGGYTPTEIAKTIVWAADCTGNNLKFWSAIIMHESAFCNSRINKSGGDAGCGQFTSPALNELRHQLRVDGAGGSGSKGMRDAMRDMVKKCYKSYGGWTDGSVAKGGYDNYMKFMAKPIGKFHKDRMRKGGQPFDRGTIKEALHNARAMHAGLLSSAMLLKFYTALKGGYTVPGSGWGGIAQYNGGGVKNYYSRIKGEFQYLPVNSSCIEDVYTSEIMEKGCEMEVLEDYGTCMTDAEADRKDVQTFDI